MDIARCLCPVLATAALLLCPGGARAQAPDPAPPPPVSLPPPLPPAAEDAAPPAPPQNPGPATAPVSLREQTSGGALRASERSEFGESGSPPPPAATGTGFDFGSYGRVGIGSDLRGHTGYGVNVVSFGSRLEEPTYLELNFYYGGTIGEDRTRRWRVVVVPAFAGDLFHFTGDFSQNFALRNAYAETENLGLRGLSLWAGSRMYRGDDIYLFDFWPLDNLNTVGGGAMYRFNQERTLLAVHLGMNRLDNLFQYEQLAVPAKTLPAGTPLESTGQPVTEATVLDRPRVVASLKATQFLRGLSALPNGKVSLYAEFHYLPAGVQQDPTRPQPNIPLKEDYGWVVGGQFGGWLRPFVFLNVFVRGSGGLGVFGDLGKPYGFDTGGQVTGARDLMVAFSSNYESKWLGLMAGGYFHVFRDADGAQNSGFNEGAVAARPVFYLTRYLHAAVELSYQARRPDTVDQLSGTHLTPQVFRASVLPIVAPLGRGTYSRPMLYGVYTVSVLNSDAQQTLFTPQDVRYGQGVVHYLGLGAEWWFNSSYR